MGVVLEILGALLQQPRLPTNLAQIVNINLGRLDEQFLDKLVQENLVKRDHIEGHDVLSITVDGRQVWEDLRRLQKKLDPDADSSHGFWA
jgi:predicted transcriptional regulator